MANPWDSSSLQVSLDPLFRLVNKFDENYKLKLNNPQHTNHNNRETFRSPFMMKLRAADELIANDRKKRFYQQSVDAYPEILQSHQLYGQLTDLYERLAVQLELINRPELLKEMIVYDRPHFVQEEISQENKEKLIYSIRSGTRAIITLLTNRSEELYSANSSLEECKHHLLSIINQMDIFNEQNDFDDYELSELYEFLMECCHAIDLIKKKAVKQRPVPIAIAVSPSTPGIGSTGIAGVTSAIDTMS